MLNNYKNYFLVRRIFIISVLSLLFLLFGISLHQKKFEKNKHKNILDHYSKIAKKFTKKKLTAKRFSTNFKEEGIYFIEGKNEYIVFSHFFAPHITGYGGPFKILIQLTHDSKIKKLHIISHNETPAWIDKIDSWIKNLNGYKISEEQSISEIHAVTGATYTTKAIIKILKKTGKG